MTHEHDEPAPAERPRPIRAAASGHAHRDARPAAEAPDDPRRRLRGGGGTVTNTPLGLAQALGVRVPAAWTIPADTGEMSITVGGQEFRVPVAELIAALQPEDGPPTVAELDERLDRVDDQIETLRQATELVRDAVVQHLRADDRHTTSIEG